MLDNKKKLWFIPFSKELKKILVRFIKRTDAALRGAMPICFSDSVALDIPVK